jgi:hypothetical protein
MWTAGVMAGVGPSELPSTSATGSKPAEKGTIGFQKCDLTPRKRNRPQTHSDGLPAPGVFENRPEVLSQMVARLG